MDILTARGLVMAYGPTRALDGVDVTVRAGESVAVMGPSGSGKTTLLHVLAGILRPTAGAVDLAGTDLLALSDAQRTTLRRTDFGFVFQSGQLLSELPAEENAALPLLLAGQSRAAATERAGGLLRRLGLAGTERRRPGELSGGQAQRVAIARALVGRPKVVFADEPTGALDQATGREVLDLLTSVARENGAALVVVTHDAGVARWCDRTLAMRDGRVVSEFSAPTPSGAGVAP
ncbi:ABC transporter ATP-binding protein [Kineococcus sp. NPDC059986]|jgi:putative ABC transport system ATP-binding protein|uniref:ABC transporter ATP-binding protein n=1 Tax=Kineococcus sp. NPDC059986 TaxID=3155538 RepID=UPI0034509606